MTPRQLTRLRRASELSRGPGMQVNVSGADLAALLDAFDARGETSAVECVAVFEVADAVLRGRPELWGLPLSEAVTQADPSLAGSVAALAR